MSDIDSLADSEFPSDLKKARRRVRPAEAAELNTDRLPPHAPEAEQGVLGCILMSPLDCLAQVITMFGDAGADVFYDQRHQIIYTALEQMFANQKPIDVITVMSRLNDFGQLEEIGGIPYLNALQDSVPSAANVTYYAAIVYEKYQLRRGIQVATNFVSRVYEFEGEVDELFDDFERDALSIRRENKKTDSSGMRELVQASIVQIENWITRSGQLIGIPTGFADFDMMTGGMQNGEVIVIAARPSMGKTSLAINIAENVALNQKLPVGIFSLEMTETALTTRMIASQARVNLRNMREGFSAESDFPRITGAAGRLSNSPIRIDDTAGLSVMQLRARARKMVQEYGIKLFIIDYLQLLHSTSRRAKESRQNEVADISTNIKEMAKELDVPVILLSQLNRELEKEKNRKPRLADLRESGAIEQDADVVGMLYKTKTADSDDEQFAEAIPVNLLIAKQRNGPTGDVQLTFLKNFTRFESAAKVSDDDVPPDYEPAPQRTMFDPPPENEQQPRE